jgi:pyrroloquinoline-quinone synthase
MTARFDSQQFWTELHARVATFDLLAHPFYQAWSAGQLSAQDLRLYAQDYYPHVAAFPTYLSALHSRLPDGELRRAVLRNLAEEEIEGRAHSELWLDFAEGMGAGRDEVRSREARDEVAGLLATFRDIAKHSTTTECLAAFYAYESQVPRVAEAKWQGLERHYGADSRTGGYFRLHRTADIRHAGVWRALLTAELERNPSSAAAALDAAERAAAALWKALDGIERERQARMSCAPACN